MRGLGLIFLLAILLSIIGGYFGINLYFQNIAMKNVENISEIRSFLERSLNYKKKFDFFNRILILESKNEIIRVYFEKDWSIKKVEIERKENFCGISTFGLCESDSDCRISGCSGQVCQSKSEKPVITTCEWRECYDYKKYGYHCGCVNGKCQWTKTG